MTNTTPINGRSRFIVRVRLLRDDKYLDEVECDSIPTPKEVALSLYDLVAKHRKPDGSFDQMAARDTADRAGMVCEAGPFRLGLNVVTYEGRTIGFVKVRVCEAR